MKKKGKEKEFSDGSRKFEALNSRKQQEKNEKMGKNQENEEKMRKIVKIKRKLMIIGCFRRGRGI